MNAANPSVSTTSDVVVSARNLRKAYKNKVALDDTAFDIPTGRIVGLIGPNGAGKTTALKAMLGLIPFEGRMSVL
ncbi:ATP-binding cassette domain-containing protein, partial [Lysobacter sp. D1-1-M9]